VKPLDRAFIFDLRTEGARRFLRAPPARVFMHGSGPDVSRLATVYSPLPRRNEGGQAPFLTMRLRELQSVQAGGRSPMAAIKNSNAASGSTRGIFINGSC